MKKKIGIHFIPCIVLMAVLLLCMVLTAGKVSASDFSDGTAEEGKYIEEDQVKPQPPVITDFKINNDSILGYGDRLKVSFKIANRTYDNSDPDKITYVGIISYKHNDSYMRAYLFYNPKTNIIENEPGYYISNDTFVSARPEGVYHFAYFYDVLTNSYEYADSTKNKSILKISNTSITFCEDCKNGKHRIDTIKYKEPTYKDCGYSNCQKCKICGTVISGKVLNPVKPYCKVSTKNVIMYAYANQTKTINVTHANGDNIYRKRGNLNLGLYTIKNGKSLDTITIKPYNKIGQYTIELTLNSGLKTKINLIVKPAKTQKIYGVKKNIIIKQGKKYTLKPKISPSYSKEKIIYSSNNKKVVAVNSKGIIIARKKGTAYITIKSGSKYVKCKITVK